MQKKITSIVSSLLFIGIAFFLFSSFLTPTHRWLALGDSITYLNDHPDETGNRVTRGYCSRVTDAMPELQYINQGHNGWTAVRIAAEIHHLGLVPADVYSVFLGTNDWWGGKRLGTLDDYRNSTGDSTVMGAFRIIMDTLHALNPKAKIVLITPMQRMDFVYVLNAKNHAYGSYQPKNGQTLEQFANAVIAIGKETGLPVIDLYHDSRLSVEKLVKFKRLRNPQTGEYQDYTYPASNTIPFDPAKDAYPYPPEAIGMTYDGLHPSDAGNVIIADKIVKVFRKLKF